MGPPVAEPIGREVSRTAKVLARAFDEVLADAGGSLPVWLVLLSLKAQRPGMQRELAEAVGIEGPTLTHHLDRMETAGLVARRRNAENRRIYRVELTYAGEAAFHRLRKAVGAFDRRLRAGFSDAELATLRETLGRLRDNVAVVTHSR